MNIAYLTILFPLIGFILLTILNTNVSKKLSCCIGVSTVIITFFVTVYLDLLFYNKGIHFVHIKLFNWIILENLKINFSILIDTLSLVMLTMVVGIGLIIHLFSCWYIEKKEYLFFAYMNLFICSMIILILSDNLLLMYLGWEGVGVCSYLLIGFYNECSFNGFSATKAFLITRIGDIFLIIGIIYIYITFGSLDFLKLQLILSNYFSLYNYYIINGIAIALTLGAISKSAQFPMHIWLINAMVGPTPASALIHAATMVTAGVYLITRTYYIFILAPNILILLGYIGIITLIIASLLALFQNNIKRILAYSTMSQIGYMFLALSVQAWNAAIVHLVCHAIFKALLFLSAASVIKFCKNEQNIFKMGGLYRKIPITYVSFLVGGASLSSFPIITASFYSKEEILYRVYGMGHEIFLYISLIGVFFTSLYMFRLIFIVFHGKNNIKIDYQPLNIFHNIPLFILISLSSFISVILIPNIFFFPHVELLFNCKIIYIKIISSCFSILGISIAYFIWKMKKISSVKLHNIKIIILYILKYLNLNNFYYITLVYPFLIISNFLKKDPLYYLFRTVNTFLHYINIQILQIQNSYLRWYSLLTISNVLLINIIILLCITN